MEQMLPAKIIDAVADAEEVEATEIDLVLSNYIDCDALELLMKNDTSPWRLSFKLPDHTVTVSSTGWVCVDEDEQNLMTANG